MKVANNTMISLFGAVRIKMYECTPLAHIVCNDKQDCCDGRHWDHSGKWHQYDEYDDQCDGVHHSGNRCASAIFDVGSGSCDRSCGRDSSE